MRNPSKGRLEGEIQAAIISYLSLRGDMVAWRNNTGGFSPRPGQFISFGKKGSADILGCQKPYGRLIAIEVKRERGGAQTREQKEWGEMISRCGGLYILARSVDEVRAALEGESMRGHL